MRRRLLINNSDGISDGVAYSGTLEVAERTYDDVVFDCPGATCFAIFMNEPPDTDTGQAFFGSIVANKEIAYLAYSTQTGAVMNMGSRYECKAPTDKSYPAILFSDSEIILKFGTYSTESYNKWFQAGKSYDWIAW